MKRFSLAILVLMLFILVGCGSSNKIVATITQTSEGLEDETTITMEMWFEKDVPTSSKTTMEFSTEEMAKGYYTYLSLLAEDDDIKIEQDGTKVIMEESVSGEDFKYKDMSKDEIIKDLEEEGWTVNK